MIKTTDGRPLQCSALIFCVGEPVRKGGMLQEQSKVEERVTSDPADGLSSMVPLSLLLTFPTENCTAAAEKRPGRNNEARMEARMR